MSKALTSLIRLDHVQSVIDNEIVLKDIHFHLNTGQIGGILGPSGCGKTTTLRCIAGFTEILQGTISLEDKVISSEKNLVRPEKRGIGMIFQDYALFPHLSVQQNVGFGLEKLSKAERSSRIKHYLELVELAPFSDKYPEDLSGGQQQRVALARALAPHPKLILMDEPFSNLDTDLRRKLSVQVRDILKQESMTAILVTHDQDEAFAMCDQIGVIHQGQLLQWDTPYNLYHEPHNRFVANFIGRGHFLRGSVVDHEQMKTELGVIRGNRAYNWPTGMPVDILIRPDDIVPDPHSSLKVEITKKAFQGAYTRYHLQLKTGGILEALFPSHHDHAEHEWIGIRLEADHLVAFQAN